MASIVLDWAGIKSYVAEVGPGRRRPERPKECPFCDGERVWFDGWRSVFCVVLLDGKTHRFDEGLPLQRVECAACHVSWTLRPAFLYPQRSLEPDVVEAASLEYLSNPEATYEGTARAYACSPRSVWRWVGWVAMLLEVGVVLAEAEALSGAGLVASMIPREVPQSHPKARTSERAATLRHALHTLVALAVWARAQAVPALDPSPLRLWLQGRFLTFGEVHRLEGGRPSPPLPEDCTGPPGVGWHHGPRGRD